MPPAKRNNRPVAEESNEPAVAVADENKDTSAAAPMDSSVTAPESAQSETPIHDELTNDLQSASAEDRTQFEEDDNPLSNVGDVVDEDEEEKS